VLVVVLPWTVLDKPARHSSSDSGQRFKASAQSLRSADTDLSLPTPAHPPPDAGTANPAEKRLCPDVSLDSTQHRASRRTRRQDCGAKPPAQWVCGSRSPTRGRHTCSGVSGQRAAPLCRFFLLGSDTRSCHWAAPRCTCPWDSSLPGAFLVLQPAAALPPCSAQSDASLNGRKQPMGTSESQKQSAPHAHLLSLSAELRQQPEAASPVPAASSSERKMLLHTIQKHPFLLFDAAVSSSKAADGVTTGNSQELQLRRFKMDTRIKTLH